MTDPLRDPAPRRGRDEQFRDFVIGSQRRLVHFAELLVSDRGRAEDLVQDAYVKAYVAWPRISPGAAEAYTRRCILNARTDWWRRRRSREQPVEAVAESTVPDISGHVDDRLAVLTALDRLTSRERAVIALRYYADLSEAETAAELGIATGTVKSTTARAVVKLRGDVTLREGVS